MLTTLIQTGVRSNDADYIQRKVKLANQLILLLFSMVIPYGILFYLLIPSLSWLTAVFILIYGSVLLLHHFGMHQAGRFVLSLLPLLTVCMLHAILLPPDQTWLTSLVCLQVALFILPWILFDLREYPYLILTSILGLLSMLGVGLWHAWLEVTVDSSFLQHQYVEAISLMISCGLVGSGLYFFHAQERRSENKLQQLLAEVKAKNQAFEQSEVETKKHLQQIHKNQQEEERRNWASEGLAKFATILRADVSLEQLYDRLISELVKYIGANQGGLYMVDKTSDQEHPVIRLVACYAYGRKKFVEQHIQIGQGLIGQVYLEKAPIFMTQVPEGYVRITSGLGQATPRSIVVMPLIVNEQVEAVLELASFTVFEPHQVSFLQTLGESIASVVASNRINLQTQQLLEESQQQAEAMRAQEEEMRQNLEEMQATQEEMRRKSSEVESRMKAIDESGMASVEFDLEGTIKRVNDNFLALMGYRWKEIEGKHHRIFVTDSYAKSPEYQQFWQSLGQGIPQMGEYERQGKGGKRIFIQGSYSILRDPEGNPTAVVKLAADITAAKLAQEQLKQQAEQLQAQEEMMRQNLEEILHKSSDIEGRMNAIDESGMASIEFDLEGTIKMANANFLALMGYGWKEIRGQHHRIFVTDSYAQSPEYQQFWQHLGQGNPHMGEYERWGKDGKRVFIQGSYSILRDAQGKPIGVLKLAADITEAKLAQEQLTHQAEELQAQEEEMRQNLEELTAMQEEIHRVMQASQQKEQLAHRLLDASSDAIFVLDQNMKLVDSNATFQEALIPEGRPLVKGDDVSERWNEKERAHLQGYYERVFKGETLDTTEFFPLLGGSYRLFHYPLQDEEGNIYACAVFAKDVKHSLAKKASTG